MHAPMGNRWHGWDADAHGLLENAGGNQSDATATGGVWSFRCLCLGDTHPHAPPQTPPIPGAARHCCLVLSVPYAVTDHLISLKSGKQKGVKAVLTAFRDALAASPTFPAPAISPRLGSLPSLALLGLFTGTRGTRVPKICPRVTAACPKVGVSLRFPQRHCGRMARGSGTEATS